MLGFVVSQVSLAVFARDRSPPRKEKSGLPL
jgi:hypothetical protein